jgi:nucleoside phosphorylase
VIDAIFVPRGAEADAVRAALGPAPSPVRVLTTGIGPRAALRAADEALAAGPPIRRVLVTGLCGLLSPSLTVGDALAYGEVRHPRVGPILLERMLIDLVAERVPGMQSGIRAIHSDTIVCSAAAKADLANRFDAEAVDMESFALAERLHRAGVAVAVVRVGSDGARDELPDLESARDGSGGLDTAALVLAMLRRPPAGLRLVANGVRALAALRRTIAALVTRA